MNPMTLLVISLEQFLLSVKGLHMQCLSEISRIPHSNGGFSGDVFVSHEQEKKLWMEETRS